MTFLRPVLQSNDTSITYCHDVDDVAAQAAELLVERAASAVASQGRFTIALSACNTAMAMNARLGSDPFRSRIPWSKGHVFLTDDRCGNSERRNTRFKMIEDVLLSRIPIPKRNVHAPAVHSDHHRAAAEYEQTLRAFFGLGTGQLPRFDVVCLEVAPDGHIASLFPDTSAVEEMTRLAVATYVHRLNEHRITLTVPVISNAATILFMVAGENRASVLREVLIGEYQPERLPSQLIRPTNGKLLYFIDQDAARRLQEK